MTARWWIGLGATGALTAQWAPALAPVSRRAARLFDVPRTLPSDRGVLLTFDDGPHPHGTPAVLAELDRGRAHAVFFVCGEQVTRFPGLVSEIAAAGHEVAVHGYRHETRRHWSRRLLSADTQRALEAISRATGSRPRLYRPPHGVFSSTGLRLVRELGLSPLLWSKWGRDWRRGATAASIARRAANDIEPGDVVLLHDADHYAAPGSWRATVAALPRILERIRAAGLEPSPIRAGTAGGGLTLAAGPCVTPISTRRTVGLTRSD